MFSGGTSIIIFRGWGGMGKSKHFFRGEQDPQKVQKVINFVQEFAIFFLDFSSLKVGRGRELSGYISLGWEG